MDEQRAAPVRRGAAHMMMSDGGIHMKKRCVITSGVIRS
jgi:hypothetical protein